MEVIIENSVQDICKLAAKFVAKQIRTKPESVIGFATGKTMVGLYRELARLHEEEALDFSGIYSFNLDEFVALDADHPCSYRRFMEEHLFQHVNIDPDRICFPDVMSSDIAAACSDYEDRIKKVGGIDLQILGIGVEGHIGFNEPTSSLASRTRLKTLAQRTMHELARHFGSVDSVPAQVLTMGVGTIMDSSKVMLLAIGQDKAEIIRKTVEGPITGLVPASALQMHQVAKVFLNDEAAQSLTLKPYYRWAYEHKPDWQRFDR